MASSFKNLIRPSGLWAAELTGRLKTLEDIVDLRQGRLGALVFGSSNQSIANSSNTILDGWDTVVYDDLGFFNEFEPDIFTIPVTDPVIERVQLYFQYSWQPDASGRRTWFLEQTDSGGVRGGIASNGMQPQAAVSLADQAYSMPIECVPGDYFRIIASQDSGDALLLSLLGFGITVAK
jgi:hypothetical protein